MLISIIIPTLNEADRISTLIASIRLLGDCEIIVVDGGSQDQTLDNASEADLLLTALPGRALQQNAGARKATGDVLLFLHADCLLTAGCLEAIEHAFNNPRCVGGCFQQRIDASGVRYRIIEYGNSLRVKLLKWAYGDQAIFVRKSVFYELGQFPEFKFMEDLFFMKKLKKKGTFVLLKNRLNVSARRWKQQGIFKQTVRNWILILLAQFGISPDRLAQYYPHIR